MTVDIIARIERRLRENKTGFKTYKSYDAAHKAASKVAKAAAVYYDTTEQPEFVVALLPNVKTFTAIFSFTLYAQRHDVGGYVGFIAHKGFMQA